MYTLKYLSVHRFQSLAQNHCSLCFCVVCSYLTNKGNADIQQLLLMFKTKTCATTDVEHFLLSALFVTLPCFPSRNIFLFICSDINQHLTLLYRLFSQIKLPCMHLLRTVRGG